MAGPQGARRLSALIIIPKAEVEMGIAFPIDSLLRCSSTLSNFELIS